MTQRSTTSFAAFLVRHKLSAESVAPIIGLSRAQAYKLRNGDQAVSPTLARLLELLDVHGIPREWQQQTATEDNGK
jgi:hypothetical protein